LKELSIKNKKKKSMILGAQGSFF